RCTRRGSGTPVSLGQHPPVQQARRETGRSHQWLMAMTDDNRNNPDPLRTVRLLWDEPEGPARGPRRGHSTAEIVAAAVGLADTRGTGALSMRQVAAAVGCGTMTLYTYVSGKAELLELMTDHVYGEITQPAR